MSLGFMRRHRRWLYVFLWIVIAAFIILYIPAFRQAQASGPAETLASVGQETITAGEFQKAYSQERQRLQDMYQGRLDANTLKSLRIEEQVFERLVAERLMALEAERLGLRVDDDALAHEIQTSPRFQRDGRFVGAAELKRVLQLRGLTLERFEEEERGNLMRQRLQALVTGGVTVGEAEAERDFRRRNEQVKLEYVLVDAAPFKAQVQASDAEAEARFKQKAESYRIPEKRVLSYALVDPDALRARVALTDAELEVYHREHRDEFKEAEQVCASHVLIKVKGAPDAKEGHSEAEARTLAEAVLAQARAGGDFAELAKKSSEDLGSAARGGELGCFPRGRMVPAFENAAFALEPGQLSELVKTDFGFHVIRVQSHKAESGPAFSQVKERIRQTLLAQRVQTLAVEKVQSTLEALAKGRALEDVAREQGLALQKSAPFERGQSPEPLSSPTLSARAFALKPGETDKEGAAVAKGYAFFALAEIQPGRAAELKDVKERVKADLLEERALSLAQSAAAELRGQALKEGLEKAASAGNRTRKETPALVGRGQPLGDLGSSASLDEAAFGLAPQVLSEPVRTPSGFALLRVLEKKNVDEAALQSQKPALMAQLRDERRSRLFQAYLSQLRQRYPVERRAEVFRRLVG